MECADVLPAVRTVRNLLHHHWARAPRFVVVEGRAGWIWPDSSTLPPPTSTRDKTSGLPADERLMAGASVADTLDQVGAVFASVEQFLM